MFDKYYESPGYGEWCRRVYGKDLKQLGVTTMSDLEVLYREVNLPPDSHILDIGCGPGYISAEIAGHYNSHLTGIDFDEGSITHARKTFSNNLAFGFIHGDGSAVSFETSTFDLILFCDSLHFTRTAEKLHELLDKCIRMLKSGGKLIIFRSKVPIDEEIKEKLPELKDLNTQVALWGKNNNLPFKEIDLSEETEVFWQRAIDEILAMESELRSEIPETYERIRGECLSVAEIGKLNTSGHLLKHRWLYIFAKNKHL